MSLKRMKVLDTFDDFVFDSAAADKISSIFPGRTRLRIATHLLEEHKQKKILLTRYITKLFYSKIKYCTNNQDSVGQ